MRKHLAYIGIVMARLLVYGGAIGFSLLVWALLLLAAAAASAQGSTPSIYVPFRWSVNTARPARQDITIRRGETIAIEPTYQSYGGPVDLTACYEVRLRYRDADLPEGTYYSATGSVVSTTGGTVRIVWSPALETTNSIYQYDIKLSGADSASLKAYGTIRMEGDLTVSLTNQPTVVTGRFDWAAVQHENIDAAPFIDDADLLGLNQRNDQQDAAISNVIVLVGDGVAGVQSNLQAHVADAAITNAAQDAALSTAVSNLTETISTNVALQAATNAAQDARIDLALESANMGGDIIGVSTQATVVATHGRLFPLAGETPSNMQAMVWSSSLQRLIWGSVDLSHLEGAIAALEATAVEQTYVDTEISRIEGLVDGNTHNLSLTEEFNGADWLQIASGVWQHNNGWMAYNANVFGGVLTLNANIGYLVLSHTQHVSRVRLSPNNLWMVRTAPTTAGPWNGYDAIRDNIPSTDQFAVRLENTMNSAISINSLQLYTWAYPERVGLTRDFAGMFLHIDTPDGTEPREAANVQYIANLQATGDVIGKFGPEPWSVEKIKGGAINASSRTTGSALVWYDSVNEHRYVDVATQFEHDAAIATRATTTALAATDARVAAVESGAIRISGGVVGDHLDTTTVVRLQDVPLDPPTSDGTSPVYDLAQNKIIWASILSSNIVYASGTNEIANVPPSSAAFYRASFQGGPIMPMVLDQQIVGWMSPQGLTIPYGSINILQSNLTSNIRLYDGSAAEPSLSTVSDPDTGWFRLGDGTWGFSANATNAATMSAGGITLAAGRNVILGDGYRAISINEIDTGSVIEQDPHAVLKSGVAAYWTHPGGTYSNVQLIATAPLSSNGYARVESDASGMLKVEVEMSDLNLTEWVPFEPFGSPGYVRIQLTEPAPFPGDVTTLVSNIVAYTWTHPELVGQTTDTAGQILHVDAATEPRQPVQLAQMQAAVGSITPSAWSAYPATQTVRLNGESLRYGEDWDMQQIGDSLFVLSNGQPYMSFSGIVGSLSGLTISGIVVSNVIAAVDIATNGVIAQPMLQWSASLTEQSWQTLTPTSQTYPDTTNGAYRIIAEMPSTAGYLRAMQDVGTARIDTFAPIYEQGERVATTAQVAAVSARVDSLEAAPQLYLDGTNLLITIGGVTNRVVLEAL